MGLQPQTTSQCPVTLAEVKEHLRIDGTDDDSTLNVYLMAACEYIETATRQQFVSRTYVLTLDSFPAERFIKLPKPPLIEVASIEYTDGAGSEQTLDAARYTVDTTTRPGRLVLRPGQSWPSTDGSAANVRVTFTAGYGTENDVPELLKQAIKFMAGHYYENREGAIDRTISTVPLAVESIVNMHMYPEAVG